MSGSLNKKTMLIVSGMGAAGKTTFAEWFSKEACIPLLSVDELWEKCGDYYDGIAQFWVYCEDIMEQSSPLIIEFGFWDEQKLMITELVEKYKYKTINIHFIASIEIAHQRFNDRRKLNGTKPQITLERYNEIVKYSKNFEFGDYFIEVDTTDFLKVSYKNIAEKIYLHTIGAV